MNSATYTNKISKLSYDIKETDEKAIVNITLEIDFPFKYLANKLALELMEYHFKIGKIYEKYRDTPHLEMAKILLELKKNGEPK